MTAVNPAVRVIRSDPGQMRFGYAKAALMAARQKSRL